MQKVELTNKVQGIGARKVPLLDWEVLRNPDLVRQKYAVSNVSQYSYPNVKNCEVQREVIKYAYNTATCWPVVRCQTFFFIGIEGYGSVICTDCMPAARYTIFTLYDKAYINKIHIHVSSLCICMYCKHRIRSKSIRSCQAYKNRINLMLIEPMYRCFRIVENKKI